MSLRIPDNRELKINVQLAAMNMTQIGSATGEYSVFAALPSPQNKNPLNFDASVNRPKVQYGDPAQGKEEYKITRGVKVMPSVQNAKMVEVMTQPSASSCTFAYGAIGLDEVHPVYDLIQGPSSTEYTSYNITPPSFIKTLQGLTKINLPDLVDIPNIQPFVPFITYPVTRDPSFFSYTDPLKTSLFFLRRYSPILKTYNIWNLYDTKPIVTVPGAINRPKYTTAKKYEGPISSTSNVNSPSIKTVRDGINGSRILVNSLGKGRFCAIKREFPVSKDFIYSIPGSTGANIFYPSRYKFTDTINGGFYYYDALDYQTIITEPSNNSGMHIVLSDIEATGEDSFISIYYENSRGTVVDNIVYSLQIDLVPDKLPTVILTSRLNGRDYYYEYTNVKGLPFNGKGKQDYDIFIHFVGPILLLGFSLDQTQWNAIYPEEISKSINNIDTNAKGNVEYFFEKDKSYVTLTTTNTTFQMRYSAIMFNNFAFDPLMENKTDDIYDEKVPKDRTTGSPYPGTSINSPNYFVYKAKNFVLTRFNAPEAQSAALTRTALQNSLGNKQYVGSRETLHNVLPEKLISIFGDYRNNKYTTLGNVRGGFPFQYREIDSILNSQFGVLQKWGKVFFDGTVEGGAFLSLTPDIIDTKKLIDFLRPIENGNLTPWVESCSVTCNSDNLNSSRIKKTANISLKNLDTTERGIRLLELLEHNVLVVTISAGYGNNNNQLQDYFQGFITNVSATRNGSSSTLTLSCTDFGSYALENLYFDELVPFGTLSLKNCLQACVNASGFANYYTILNESEIIDLNLRIADNAAASQDVLQATQYDRVGPKINTFLEKLVSLEHQPTFRWEENSGFILDSRYAQQNCDTDLKFINYDFENDYIKAVNSTNNQSTPDWHGLLIDSFSIETNLANIVSEIQTFGVTTIDGTRFAKSTDAFIQNALSTTRFNQVITALNTTGEVPKGYVGFRKKILDYLDQYELPSKELLALKHAQNEKIAERPFHSISFSCYVTKPLKFHGTFVINAFVQNLQAVTTTDQYIYTSLNYNFDKSTNLITASVSGQAQPWTIKELQIREGTILADWLK